MKKVFGKMYLGGALLLSLSMCLTSCEGTLDDVLGEWSRPSEPAYSVSSLTLDKDSIVLALAGGETTAKLTATIVGNPGNQAVSFLSSDDTKATVDFTSGEVTAVGGGWVKIYATIGEFIDSCSVMVFNQIHDISTGDAAIPANEYWLISGTTTANKITIAEGSSAYLKGVSITTTTGSCIQTTGMGEIYLVDGTTNTMDASGANFFAAVNTAGGQLTIYGQTAGTGKLVANGGTGGAGIGGSLNGNYNSIVIKGGEIEATGGASAAGIGSGYFNNSATSSYTNGDITISGGKVTATGYNGGAGIGTGVSAGNTYTATCGSIKIEKTVVSVTATKDAGFVQDCIGKGNKVGSQEPTCGAIFFDTKPVAESAHAGTSAYTTAPTAGTYGGLVLAISGTGDTWTLTPTN